MSDAVTMMQRLQTVQDASAEFLLRWVAQTMMDETLNTDMLWRDLCLAGAETEISGSPFSKYRGRLDD